MRVLVLRHEKRNEHDPTFWSPLIEEGHINANDILVPRLNDHYPDFTHIYTSAFVRCLQTIVPYCQQTNIETRLKIEHGLYERIVDDGGHDPINFRQTWSLEHTPSLNKNQIDTYEMLNSYVDTTYTSWWPIERIYYGESVEAVQLRATSLLTHLQTIHNKDDVVLLVTHRSIVNAMLGKSDDNPFPMGGIAEVHSEL